MARYSTGDISGWVCECDDLEELKARILPLLENQRAMWMEKIRSILAERGYSVRKMAQLCQVSEPAVRKWMRGSLPQSRDMYIRIGFAAGYGLDEMNSFLMRYGRCPQLYVRSPEDLVCIFVLRSDTLDHTYAQYRSLLDIVRSSIGDESSEEAADFSTRQLTDLASCLHSLDEMLRFAAENAQAFQRSYGNFYDYVNSYVEMNISNEFWEHGDGRKASFHSMAMESQWTSSLRYCVSEIRNRRWFPMRNKVISLGLHLNMDVDAINQMLLYAQMEPLYVKNPIEAVVVWAVEDAKLNSPDDSIIPDGSADLCSYVKDVLIRLDLAESEFLLDDL